LPCWGSLLKFCSFRLIYLTLRMIFFYVCLCFFMFGVSMNVYIVVSYL
jgi:hypothetical protein